MGRWGRWGRWAGRAGRAGRPEGLRYDHRCRRAARSAALQGCPRAAAAGESAGAVHQGSGAGHRAHACARHRRHRRGAARGSDDRHPRRQHRRDRRGGEHAGAQRRDRRRSHRQERDPGARDDARASLLHHRSRRVRTTRRQLLPPVSRRRRDDDADGGKRERDHGHQRGAADRRRRDAGTGDRRDRAVRQRSEHLPADAHRRKSQPGAHPRWLLAGAGRDVGESVHADLAGVAERRD